MRIDEMPSIVRMKPDVLSNLVKEVKETLATDIKMPKAKQNLFTYAQLWNIRRKASTAHGRYSR